MKLWLLKPNNNRDSLDNPWLFTNIVCMGVIVRAEDENSARSYAVKIAANEGAKAWMLPGYSTCEELEAAGEPGVIMWDLFTI